MAKKSISRDSHNVASALLPAGFADVLPPTAEIEAAAVETLIAEFRRYGYARVKPPLIEFETDLLAGTGATMAEQTFRLMDPVSQRMMGVRADITVQVARIATTRLTKMPRPLRLSYAGQVLRVRGTQLRPERQFTQVGAELVGVDTALADAEIIILSASSLQRLGIKNLSVDLALPGLASLIVNTKGVPENLQQALDRRDARAAARLAGPAGKSLAALIKACGPIAPAMKVLDRVGLPKQCRALVTRLHSVVVNLSKALPELVVTVDFVEQRGFAYEQGIAFTLFARGVRGELGRGGDYVISSAEGAAQEAACGVTLYMDSILRGLPQSLFSKRLFAPCTTDPQRLAALRQEGWIVIMGLSKVKSDTAEARRLNCTHVLIKNKPQLL
ncbi:MAG: ATP phosphoribosyltransferase regulatory subunit [Alphaproteobacteria bacterium]